MSSQKSKWIIFTAAIACMGCCAIPLYVIVAGTSGIGLLTVLMSEESLDMLVCLVPLLLIAIGYYVYERKNRKACCTSPKSECSKTQCTLGINK